MEGVSIEPHRHTLGRQRHEALAHDRVRDSRRNPACALHGGSPTPASQLAREGRLPERFLVQILRYLVTNGVLTSACGVSGGYSLARPPRK